MADRPGVPGLMPYQENLPEVYYEPSPPPPNTHDALSLPPLPPKNDYDTFHMHSTPATQYGSTFPPESRKKKGNLWLIIALVLAVIVAIIGIALGAYFSSQYNSLKNSCPVPTQSQTSQPQSRPSDGNNSTQPSKSSSSTAPAATGVTTALVDPQNYTQPIPAAQIGMLAWPPYPCPTAVVPGTYNASFAFKVYCNTTLGATDLAPIIAYSINDCLDACISYNQNPSRINGTECLGWSMALGVGFFAVHGTNGNCFLKNGPLPGMSTASHSQIFGPVWSGVMCKTTECKETYAGI